MEHSDPARYDVVQSMTIASQIASLDEDEKTRRAAAMWGLNRSIENLPVSAVNFDNKSTGLTFRFNRP